MWNILCVGNVVKKKVGVSFSVRGVHWHHHEKVKICGTSCSLFCEDWNSGVTHLLLYVRRGPSLSLHLNISSKKKMISYIYIFVYEQWELRGWKASRPTTSYRMVDASPLFLLASKAPFMWWFSYTYKMSQQIDPTPAHKATQFNFVYVEFMYETFSSINVFQLCFWLNYFVLYNFT